jgi:hypothetical protein
MMDSDVTLAIAITSVKNALKLRANIKTFIERYGETPGSIRAAISDDLSKR